MEVKVWAVVPAKNVEKSISNTLRQLNRAKVHKTLVVCNGCSDKTLLRIKETIPDLSMEVELLEIPQPLGHDIPRAYGAIYAYRQGECSHLLFIDGDWSGSFGPMLESFMKEYFDRELDVMWAPFREEIKIPPVYLAPWRSVKQLIPPVLEHANPAIAPLMVRTAIFSLLSPLWLHHPGKWFAYAIRLSETGLRLGVSTLWDIKLTGHVLQDYAHDEKMKETLLGDAAEGSCILASKPFSRVFEGKTRNGFHQDRRVDLLLEIISSIHLRET